MRGKKRKNSIVFFFNQNFPFLLLYYAHAYITVDIYKDTLKFFKSSERVLSATPLVPASKRIRYKPHPKQDMQIFIICIFICMSFVGQGR